VKVLPRHIDFLEMEEKWQRQWEADGTHRYDWDDEVRPVYSIDTPPPYPSGDFHMGNFLNWTYFDVRARYKRMRGYNVLFPQGWDCHGLPTEVRVEKAKGIRKSDVPPDVFRRMCEEWIEQYIGVMKTAVIRMGCSVDWTTEYRTMEPEYMRKIQLSFLQLYEKDMIYKGEHPINWCPRCETAIADAEVEHETKRGRIYTIPFFTEDGEVLIATTRPVYLPACVALGVHPEDKRYKYLIGGKARVPVFGQEVPIIANDEVDPTFGTGAMMICTYGDKADVVAVARFNLPVVKLIDGRGILQPVAGKYAGMPIDEGQEALVEAMREAGLIKEEHELDQEVGLCWRCDTPIEVVTALQWFMRTISLTDKVVETAKRITWYPDWMRQRLIDWATGLDWDWVLSRQRVFATPVPAWYCKSCGKIRLAKPEELPVDPKVTSIDDVCECGGTEFVPDTDVMDTWFDSSLTCAIHAGWPDRPNWRRQFPASVHPSGQDIIRTWAYYLMVRHLALFEETAYESALINGMVFGSDGRMMSKSLGNYVATPEVFSKYGADAPRQWAAAGGSTGTDIPFRWEDVEYGWRFMRKLWNACRFTGMRLQDYDRLQAPEDREEGHRGYGGLRLHERHRGYQELHLARFLRPLLRGGEDEALWRRRREEGGSADPPLRGGADDQAHGPDNTSHRRGDMAHHVRPRRQHTRLGVAHVRRGHGRRGGREDRRRSHSCHQRHPPREEPDGCEPERVHEEREALRVGRLRGGVKAGLSRHQGHAEDRVLGDIRGRRRGREPGGLPGDRVHGHPLGNALYFSAQLFP